MVEFIGLTRVDCHFFNVTAAFECLFILEILSHRLFILNITYTLLKL